MEVFTIFNILAFIIGYIVYGATGSAEKGVLTMIIIIVLGFSF